MAKSDVYTIFNAYNHLTLVTLESLKKKLCNNEKAKNPWKKGTNARVAT